MSKLKSTALAALVLFATIGFVASPAAAAGDVTISVEDDAGNAVEGVTVTLYDAADDTQVESGTTGTEGDVTFASVADGDYYAEMTSDDYEDASTGTFTVSGSAVSETITTSETYWVDITFDQTDWNEIVVSNVTSNHADYENVTAEGEELPAIDLSELENGTEVTFDWTTVDATAFHIDDEEGTPVEDADANPYTDETGIVTVEWDSDLDDEADAYRFEAATAYDNEDVIGTFGADTLAGSVSASADNVDQMSAGVGAIITAVIASLVAAMLMRD